MPSADVASAPNAEPPNMAAHIIFFLLFLVLLGRLAYTTSLHHRDSRIIRLTFVIGLGIFVYASLILAS